MNHVNELKWTKNKVYSSAYKEEELRFFQESTVKKVMDFQKTHPSYTHTPLVSLSNLAHHLNVKDIKVKDEAHRFGLNAFKVMGGIYAIGRYLAKQLNRDMDALSFDELRSTEVKAAIGDVTFISATDGNHGKGVAWAARELGQKSIIYLPKGSTEARLKAIQDEGAHAEIKDMNYDETVRLCADLADENGWVMVQDTAWEGYDEIPLWVMQGYASIAKEVIEALETENDTPPTHLFLQAGVGSFAASIAAYFVEHYRDKAPKIIIVEPNLADCYYQSFISKHTERKAVSGDMDSIMAGLCCGEPNTRAFRILRQYAFSAFSCPDSLAALGMRILGNPLKGDESIVSGESGAVTLGLLYYLRNNNVVQACEDIGLDEHSRILLINTEGDTDAEHYREVVWKGWYPLE